MEPRIELLSEKKLIGNNIEMSLLVDKTRQLWMNFSPRIKEIKNRISEDKISLQIYPDNYYKKFNPNNNFTKWAAVEVSDIKNIPEKMESFVIKNGLYAVFNYKGNSSNNSIFEYIFSKWIPASNYVVDNRPHFEVLGEKYKNNNPNSEEEIWIPIKEK